MEEIINVDYIGIIRQSNGHMIFKQEKIVRNYLELVRSLKDMVLNENKSVLDLQEHFTNVFDPNKSIKKYNYCYPYRYKNTYLSHAIYPELFTFNAYFTNLNEYIEKEKKLLVENETYKENPTKLELELERLKHKYITELKSSFSEQAERYIDAFNYKKALALLKTNKSNIMFSTETIGWTDYKYSINDDITCHLKSNFGYGYSSYFFVNFKYKGIDILPYSYAVKYYYANMEDLIRYTRLYSVERDSWNVALDFIVKTSNEAINYPKEFIKKWICNEIDEMMLGLKRIAENPEQSHNEIKENKFAEERVISVRNISKYQKELYRVYPEELIIAFQAEKITGAIYFIDNLKKLTSIYHKVQDAIKEIICINKKLYPVFNNKRTEIEKEIIKKEDDLNKLKLKKKRIEDLCIPHKEAIQKLINEAKRAKRITNEKEMENVYISKHEDYADLNKQLKVLKDKIKGCESDIQKRQFFADKLLQCITYAESIFK